MKAGSVKWFGLALTAGVFLAGCAVEGDDEDPIGFAAADLVDEAVQGSGDVGGTVRGIDVVDPEPDPWTGAVEWEDPEPDPWAPVTHEPEPDPWKVEATDSVQPDTRLAPNKTR